MFQRIEKPSSAKITFIFEGRPIYADEDDTVATALLASGEKIFRSTPISGAARGPFCMMGVCFDCLLEIDGVPNCQACMVQVVQGMYVRRQQGMVEVNI